MFKNRRSVTNTTMVSKTDVEAIIDNYEKLIAYYSYWHGVDPTNSQTVSLEEYQKYDRESTVIVPLHGSIGALKRKMGIKRT